jgi:hypothetical protein
MSKPTLVPALVFVLFIGCGGAKSAATKHEAGQDAAPAAADSTAVAAQVCDAIDRCEGVALFASSKDCRKQIGAQLQAELSTECSKCIATITCAGWKAISKGDKQTCEICSGCACSADAGGGGNGTGGNGTGGNGFSDSCTTGSKSVPNSLNDPCPQNDPKCPATMYIAVAFCGPDLRWTKGADGAIQCACLPNSQGTGGSPVMEGPKCGNGVIEAGAGEQCEGANLMNATCASLGLGTGTLKCIPTVCRFDTSFCGPPPMPQRADAGGPI